MPDSPAHDDPDDAGALTLIVETPAGLLLRRIPNPSPLSPGRTGGTAAEEAVHDEAAIWGLPDFTFRGHVVDVGSGARELGDNLVIVGTLGIVVQVKRRAALSQDAERERRWIEKHSAAALSQARGTVRRLRLRPVELTNARGRSIEVDGNALRWISVVVIDHPSPPPDVMPPAADPSLRVVVMLRRDWSFLFDQLRSTHAVGAYLERVARMTQIALGDEPVRYFELAMADQQAEPGAIDPALAAGGRIVSAPLLPMDGVPSDTQAHMLVRAIFEDIATAHFALGDENQRLALLAELDRLPVNHRSDIGRFLIDGLAKTTEVPNDETVWRQRRFVGGLEKVHLAFAVCSQFSDMLRDLFGYWVQLRHYDHLLVRGVATDLTTVGVLLSPRHDGNRPFDTTMIAVRGHLKFGDDELRALRDAWPTPD